METTFDGRVIMDIAGRFVVPGYQRGYRWGTDEVVRLLNDIEASVAANRNGDKTVSTACSLLL